MRRTIIAFELCPLEEWIRYISCKSIEIILSDKTILVVNDDSDIADLFAAALQTAGFKSNVTNDAALALEKIKSDPYGFSLILIDRTSQQDLDFPRIVKGINDRVKVVLASAFAFNDVEISKSGYDKVLQLPVTMSELVTIVREVLS